MQVADALRARQIEIHHATATSTVVNYGASRMRFVCVGRICFRFDLLMLLLMQMRIVDALIAKRRRGRVDHLMNVRVVICAKRVIDATII